MKDKQVKKGKLSTWIVNYESEFGVGAGLVVLFIVLTLSSEYFLTPRNMINILYQVSTVGILAVAQTMVLISGGIDLSVGSIFEMSGWVMCYSIVNFGFWEGLILGLVVAILCGLINGLIIAYVKIEPFIVTLGTMSVFHGLVYIISGAKPVSNLPEVLSNIDKFKLLGIPSYIIILIVVFILGQLFLSYTKPGRMFYALGSNETAAKYSGINTALYKMIPYVAMGICAFIAVFVQSAHLLAIDPDVGTGLNMDTIAAVVIGGASLAGGKGTMVGTAIGILLMGFMRNGLNLLGVSSYWQGVVVGTIIVLAVGIEKVTGRRKSI